MYPMYILPVPPPLFREEMRRSARPILCPTGNVLYTQLYTLYTRSTPMCYGAVCERHEIPRQM